MNSLQVLPFYNLNDREFNLVNGIRSVQFSQLMDTDMFNLISNPDKSDEIDPDLMLTIPMSNYYSISQINNSIAKAGPKAISMFHCNVRSLPKNLVLLEDFLYSLDKRPEILAITETRLNENSVCNVDLLNYDFYHTDSPTLAGGAAIYIAKTLNSIPRPDIKFNMQLVESCWVEIDPGNGKAPILIGSIYRHPGAKIEEFTKQLDDFIKKLQNRYQLYILGMYRTHFLSNNPVKTAEYKKYANKLNHVKTVSKRVYYCKQFNLHRNNLKVTWKLIGTLIKRNTKGQMSPSRIIMNNKTFTNKLDIAEQFNKYFISVGPSLASTIDDYDEVPTKYINKSPVSSFIMSPVEATQVCRLFQNLNENKTSLDIPNKLIKIASEPLSIPFAYIYNQSIANGIVPDVFKISRVTPIYKSYAANQNFFKPSVRTNYGISTFKFSAIKIWESVPLELKRFPYMLFKKKYKRFLLSTQLTID